MNRPRGVHWWTSAALIVLGLTLFAAIAVERFGSQYLIEHRFWLGMLQSVSAEHAARVRAGQSASLPETGLIRSWYVEDGRGASRAPAHLLGLPPGRYSTETGFSNFTEIDGFKARVVSTRWSSDFRRVGSSPRSTSVSSKISKIWIP
jgi:hypothetical protein